MADLPGFLLPLLVLAPFVLALALGVLPKAWGWWLGALLAIGETFLLVWTKPSEGMLTFALPWIEVWDVSLAFRLDALSWVFSLVVTSVAATVLVFSGAYMPREMEEKRSRRTLRSFYRLILFFMASMLGLVLADDLITLYVFWELISIASFLLIGFHLQEEEARRAALHSLVLTGGSGLFFFASLMLLLHGGASASIHELLGRTAGWLESIPSWPLVAFGILFTAAAKSVLLPFYGWLPAAMAAPTPVSALLHSATLVASGIYLVARFLPLLGPLPGIDVLLPLLGALTALIAGGAALVRTKLKEVLAWSTISYYGQAFILLGLGAESAAIYFFAFHAFAKAGLFLVAGALTHATGSDDIREYGGLWRSRPGLSLLAAILALGLAGFPPAAGFWMKELLFHEVYASNRGWLVAAAFGSALLSVAYFSRLLWCVFFSPPHGGEAAQPGRAPLLLLAAPGFLAAMLMISGVPSVGRWLGNPEPLPPLDLHLPWPLEPYNFAALLSLPFGLAAFAWFQKRRGYPSTAHPRDPHTPNQVLRLMARDIGVSRLFEGTNTLLGWVGGWISRLQTGKLAHYVFFLVAVPVIAGIAFLPSAIELYPDSSTPQEETPVFAIFTLTLAIAALALVSTIVKSHVSAILAVGGVGYLIAVVFALLRAPDIAFVQMVVETATALLLLAALSRIPPPLRERVLDVGEKRPRVVRAGAALAASLLGASIGIGLFGSIRIVSDPSLGKAFYRLTEREGSQSVVKAVLADFRAMDTLGEITVFTTAVLGAVLLLGRRQERHPRAGIGTIEKRSEEP